MSNDEWVQEVEAAAAERGPSAGVRTSDAVAARMIDQGAVPDVDVRSADFRDTGLLVADRFWRLRFVEFPVTGTAVECARWMDRHVAEEARTDVELRWGLGYGFLTSCETESADQLAAAAESLAYEEDREQMAWFSCLVHAGKLRANYRFRALREFLSSSPLMDAAGGRRREPIMVALDAFAAFGSGRVQEGRKWLDWAWREIEHAPAGFEAVMDVCLNGVAAAPNFRGQGELLVERGLQAEERCPASSPIRAHLAVGQALMGGYGVALVSVEEALDLLSATGSRSSHVLLREQLIALRRSIIDQRRAAGQWAEY